MADDAQTGGHFRAALEAAQQDTGDVPADPGHFRRAVTEAESQLPPETAPPTWTEGLVRGVRDFIDTPAEWLAAGADRLGINPLLHTPTGADVAAGNHAALSSYNAPPGFDVPRIVGNVAAAVPMAMGANNILRAVPYVGGFLAGEGGAGAAGRIASGATSGAVLGAGTGAVMPNPNGDPIGDRMLEGAATGAALGGALPAVGGVVGALTGARSGVAPETAQLAKLARDVYDIPVTAPLLSNNSLVRIAYDQSSKLPFSGAGASTEAVQSAWQKAVINTMGENSEKVTPDVMKRAATRIGGVFNDVADRTNIAADSPFLDALGTIEKDALSAPLGAEGHGAIKSQIDTVLKAAADGNGMLSGATYQQLTRAGSPLQRAEHAADPNVRYYAGQVRDALDDAFQRSAAPDDQAALGKARGQWRAMKTIEDLAEKSTDGNISPALLMGQVRGASSRFDSSTGGVAYTGGGALGDLARIGQQFLKPQANSGTPDRLLVNSVLGGGGVAGMIADPIVTPSAIAAGLVANRGAGSYLRSNFLANRVINNSLAAPPDEANLLSALQRGVPPSGAAIVTQPPPGPQR